MAITFSGEFTSPRTPDEVYDFLSDPNKFAPLLPDFESMSVQDATHFTVKVRVGVGNIRGSAEIKMELAEASRPQRALYKGQGTAVGSQVKISAGFDLSPLPEGTKVAWQGEAGVFGKLASMAGGMLEPLSKKNIQKLIDGLKWALTWPAAQGVAQEAPSQASHNIPAEQPVQESSQGPPIEAAKGASGQPASSTAELPSAGLRDSAAEPTPIPIPDESHGDVLQSATDANIAQRVTGEALMAGPQDSVAEQTPVAEEPHTSSDASPQGGTNVAQDVSPG